MLLLVLIIYYENLPHVSRYSVLFPRRGEGHLDTISFSTAEKTAARGALKIDKNASLPKLLFGKSTTLSDLGDLSSILTRQIKNKTNSFEIISTTFGTRCQISLCCS